MALARADIGKKRDMLESFEGTSTSLSVQTGVQHVRRSVYRAVGVGARFSQANVVYTLLDLGVQPHAQVVRERSVTFTH